MAISRAEADSILAPFKPTILEVISSAYDDYQTQYTQVSPIHTVRTQANILRDHMVYHARRLFHEMDGVRIIEKAGLFLVEIQNTVILRFKKFDDDERTSNYPTDQAVDYLEQQELPWMPQKATRLEVGYQLNKLGTAFRALIARPRGFGLDPAWVIDLLNLAAAEEAVEPGTQLELKIDKKKRVRVKSAPVKKVKEAKHE